MRVIKHDLPNFETLEIVVVADKHLGDPLSDARRVKETVNYVMAAENRFMILNGDLMDAAIKSSIGDVYGAVLTPMQQLELCVNIFGKAKSHILLVNGGGNHELRIYKQDGLDMTKLMCQELGLLKVYTPTSGYIFLRFGASASTKHHGNPILYRIYANHGSGGGRKEGGKINRLADMTRICDADIYIHSHTHLPAIFMDSYYRPSSARSTISSHNRLFVNTGANLDYGGYAELQGYPPASLANPLITLSGRQEWMRGSIEALVTGAEIGKEKG